MNTRTATTLAILFLATAAAAQWQQTTPAASPAGRSGAGMTWNPVTGSLLLFGGDTGAFPNGASNESWSYDGSTWTQLAPTVSPNPVVGIELVHDPVRGVFVFYGGLNTSFFGGPSIDQTWEYNGTTWTQITTVNTPGGLGVYGMCFDSVRNRTVLYGGQPNSFFPIAANGTWEYDGNDWTQVTTLTSPGPLERPAMCFHQGLGRTVMFGGIDPQVGGVDTTWLYDGTNWTAAAVTGPRPAVRTGAKMAYDSDRGVCVLTGGIDPNNGNQIVDSWEFDGSGWTQIASTTTGRRDGMLAYDPSRDRVVQFGGIGGSGGFTTLGDTWEYSMARVIGAGCAGSNGVPKLSAAAGPRLGQNYVLELSNLAATVPITVLVLSLTETPAQSLAVIGMPGCFAYVTPDVLLTLSSAAGLASLPVPVPTTATLTGLSVLGQGLGLDPGINAAGLVTSNALTGRIGQ
jgi:hypothetical protein